MKPDDREPAAIVERDCVAVFPSFRAYRAERGWYSADDDGAVAPGALLILLAWLVQERLPRVSDRQWRRLGALARVYYDRGEPVRGMLGACPLEPLDGPPYTAHLLRHFDREVLRYYRMSGTVPMHSRGDLLDAAWEVARNYRGHGRYGTAEKACRALRGRRPGFTDRQYGNALRKALALVDASVEVVARHAAELHRQTDVRADKVPGFADQAAEVRPGCPGFPAATYRAALLWAFYQYHLR
jgi:hypothetical protein